MTFKTTMGIREATRSWCYADSSCTIVQFEFLRRLRPESRDYRGRIAWHDGLKCGQRMVGVYLHPILLTQDERSCHPRWFLYAVTAHRPKSEFRGAFRKLKAT